MEESNAGQKPTKIVISQADIEREKKDRKTRILKEREEATDLSDTNTTHPLNRESIIKLINIEFPNIQLDQVDIPKMSENTDMMEEWESARILKRRDRIKGESDWQYTMRVIYEELFGVNQAPGDDSVFEDDKREDYNPMQSRIYKETTGMTPGGLISHMRYRDSYNNMTLEKAAKMNPRGGNTKSALEWFKKDKSIEPHFVGMDFLEMIQRCTDPRFQKWNFEPRYATGIMGPHQIGEIFTGKRAVPTDWDTYGYRLIKMIASEPQMMANIKDREFLTTLGYGENANPNGLDILQDSWRRSRNYYANIGKMSEKDNPKVHDLVKRLLLIRTHPEMQVFFKYISPSGYINEAVHQENQLI